MHSGVTQVVPSESKFELLKTKIEIRLKKASVVSWPTLEKSEKKIAANFSNTAMEQPPSYPSSFTKCAPACCTCRDALCPIQLVAQHTRDGQGQLGAHEDLVESWSSLAVPDTPCMTADCY